MSSIEKDITKNNIPNILNFNGNYELNLTNIGQFNTFKFKHFNNFFNNLFHDKLKTELINYLSEKNNKSTSIFKNEILNETLSEKTLSDYTEKAKRIIRLNKNNGIINTKLQNIVPYLSYKTNGSTKYKSLDKIYLNKFNKSKLNNKSTSINSKYVSKELGTIPNRSNRANDTNNKIKLKLDISSINHELFFKGKKNKFSNTSKSYFNKINKKIKAQQLPKDAANCLLLFLKKNKKHLQRTSKYYLIYEKYKDIIDNIIENIPDEDINNRKNNYENMLGYYKRRPMEGNDIIYSTSLIMNNYNSKSERERHIQILSELTKLKGYTNKNKVDKILYIKDFLKKYNISYNKEQLLIFEKFLDDFDIKRYEKFLEPGLRIKDMIGKIFDEGEKFKTESKKKNSMPVLNLKSAIHSNENKNKEIVAYSWYKKNNNQFNEINHEKNLNLSDTSSYLKEMERQKLVEKPYKTYSSNYNLIVNDLGKEIGKLETEIITEKKIKNIKPALLDEKSQKKISQIDNDLFVTSNTFLKSHTNKNKSKYLSPNLIKDKKEKYKIKYAGMTNEKTNAKYNYEKVELQDVKRKLKLTEYIIYNKAKNKLKLKELGKGELFEYTKKQNSNIKK